MLNRFGAIVPVMTSRGSFSGMRLEAIHRFGLIIGFGVRAGCRGWRKNAGRH